MDGDGLEELLIEITLVTSDGSSVRKPIFFFTTNEDASELGLRHEKWCKPIS